MIHDESIPFPPLRPLEAPAADASARAATSARTLRGGVPPMFAGPQPAMARHTDGDYEAELQS